MLKRWMVLVVFLAVAQAAVSVPRVTANPKSGSSEQTNNGTESSKSPSASVRVGSQQPPSNTRNNEDPRKEGKDGWDKAAVLSNYLLVLVGILGVVYAARTLGKLKEQTKAARDAVEAGKDSANAALDQAKAVVNAERAWVMAEAKFEPGGGIFLSGEQSQAVVELSLTNGGPTPAWVYEQWVQLRVTREVIASREKHPSPQFPFIGQGKKAHVNYGIHPITQGQGPVTWKAYVRDDGFPTPENGLHAYIFGVVRYRDAFSSLRETYFGYIVREYKRLERIPNEAYNRHS